MKLILNNYPRAHTTLHVTRDRGDHAAEVAPRSISNTNTRTQTWTPKHNRPSLPSIRHAEMGRVCSDLISAIE